jgi:hypothetical protein
MHITQRGGRNYSFDADARRTRCAGVVAQQHLFEVLKLWQGVRDEAESRVVRGGSHVEGRTGQGGRKDPGSRRLRRGRSAKKSGHGQRDVAVARHVQKRGECGG